MRVKIKVRIFSELVINSCFLNVGFCSLSAGWCSLDKNEIIQKERHTKLRIHFSKYKLKKNQVM